MTDKKKITKQKIPWRYTWEMKTQSTHIERHKIFQFVNWTGGRRLTARLQI